MTVTATSGDGTAALALSFNNGTQLQHPLTNDGGKRTNTDLGLPANVVAVQVVSQDLSQTNVYTVNVLLQPSQTVPHLTNSVSGNNLVLSWPADHLGYRLLVQTNNLNKGVSSNIERLGHGGGLGDHHDDEHHDHQDRRDERVLPAGLSLRHWMNLRDGIGLPS